METRYLRFVWIGVILCFLLRSGEASIVAVKDRADDKRLETRVTISAPSIYLGQLLEKLSAQTGVELSTKDDVPASGIRLTVFLHNVTLGDAMNALWSLVSYQKAEWDWNWRGEPDKRRYFLVQTAEAKNLASVLRGEIQTAYEQEAATLIASLTMTNKERKQQAKEHPELAVDLVQPYVQAGLGVFADAFPGDSYLKVLRTQQPIRVSIAKLSARSQATIRSLWRENGSINGQDNPDLPADVVFSSEMIRGRVYPSMFLLLAGGGSNYLGAQPAEEKARANIDTRWMLPDDQSMDASEKSNIKPPDKQVNPDDNTLGNRLQQMADAVPLSLMAKVPPSTSGHTFQTADSPYNQTVKEYLKALRAVPLLQAHKWRDGILLISSPVALLDAESNTPYVLIRKLHRAAQVNKGWLPLDILAEAADTLSTAQLGQLETEYPMMRTVAGFRDLLSLYHRSPEMGASGGLAMNADVAAALTPVGQGYYANYVRQGNVGAVRLYGKLSSSVLYPQRFEVWMTLLSSQKPPVNASIFYELEAPK